MNGIVLLGIAIFLLVVMMRTIRIVPQKQVKIIERLGKFHRMAEAGMNTIVPPAVCYRLRSCTQQFCYCIHGSAGSRSWRPSA